MIHSLGFRLLTAFILIIAVTVGTVYFFVSRQTTAEIARFEERDRITDTARIQFFLSDFYTVTGGWSGVQPIISRIGSMERQRVVLTDIAGVVVADSDEELTGQKYHPGEGGTPLHRQSIRPRRPPPPGPPPQPKVRKPKPEAGEPGETREIPPFLPPPPPDLPPPPARRPSGRGRASLTIIATISSGSTTTAWFQIHVP